MCGHGRELSGARAVDDAVVWVPWLGVMVSLDKSGGEAVSSAVAVSSAEAVVGPLRSVAASPAFTGSTGSVGSAAGLFSAAGASGSVVFFKGWVFVGPVLIYLAMRSRALDGTTLSTIMKDGSRRTVVGGLFSVGSGSWCNSQGGGMLDAEILSRWVRVVS